MIHLTLIYALVAAVLAGIHRLLPPPLHPWNLTMIGALGLFGAARLRPWLGLVLPVVVWGVTDLIHWQITGYRAFNPFVCTSFLLYGLLGLTLRRTSSPARIGGTCLLGSMLFFLITNFGVWLGSRIDPAELPAGRAYLIAEQGSPYPRGTIRYADNMEGLLVCYARAIPFFGSDAPPLGFLGNVLLGDLLFCGAL